MYGAIIGDIVGSKYEFRPIKTKEFPFVSRGCEFTDDTVMTVAVARALLKAREAAAGGAAAGPGGAASGGAAGLEAVAPDEAAAHDWSAPGEATAPGEPAWRNWSEPFKEILVREMQELGRRFPGAGYGGRFAGWLAAADPRPYNSFGNGSAMRVSPCGLIASELDEALALAKASAEVTHDHPEGVRGAQAVAACIFLAKTGRPKEEIRAYVEDTFYKPLPSVADIRPSYTFDVTCQGSVPEAIACFLESTDYEDAVRNAVSLGGDADTQAAIAGSIAWTYYRFYQPERNEDGSRIARAAGAWPQWCEDIVAGCQINELLPHDFVETIEEFDVTKGS